MRRIVTVLALAVLAACGDESSFDEPALREAITEVYPDATDTQVAEVIEAVRGYCDTDTEAQRFAQAIALDDGAPERIILWEAACPIE